MIDTLTAGSTAARAADLVLELVGRFTGRAGAQVAALQALGVHLALGVARGATSVVLAGPVPTVNPTEPPGGAKVMTVVGWVGWGVFAASIAGVLVICIKMATSAHRNRAGDGGGEEAGKLFWPLLACIVGSSAGSILGVVA